jgi:hypothetical protein
MINLINIEDYLFTYCKNENSLINSIKPISI